MPPGSQPGLTKSISAKVSPEYIFRVYTRTRGIFRRVAHTHTRRMGRPQIQCVLVIRESFTREYGSRVFHSSPCRPLFINIQLNQPSLITRTHCTRDIGSPRVSMSTTHILESGEADTLDNILQCGAVTT